MFWTGSVPSGSELRRALRKWGVTAAVVSGLAAGITASIGNSGWALARSPERPAVSAPVPLHALPPEARHTHRLIHNGGPFPYEKDGTVFHNRERLLPQHARGHYREYTVKTPGARDRGARRIVCGGAPPVQPQACFYTDDHYASFSRIQP